jgi:hypothetical protein
VYISRFGYGNPGAAPSAGLNRRGDRGERAVNRPVQSGNRIEGTVNRPVHQWKSHRGHRQQACAPVEIASKPPSTGLCTSGNRIEATVNRPVHRWKSHRSHRQQACIPVEVAANRPSTSPSSRVDARLSSVVRPVSHRKAAMPRVKRPRRRGCRLIRWGKWNGPAWERARPLPPAADTTATTADRSLRRPGFRRRGHRYCIVRR